MEKYFVNSLFQGRDWKKKRWEINFNLREVKRDMI